MNFFVQRSELRDLYDKVVAGERISDADALRLFESKDLNALGVIADFVNQRKNGRRQNDQQKGAPFQDQPAIFDWKKIEAAFDREPGADRRQSQSQAEENVREIGEPFGQRIKADTKQPDRRKVKTDWIDEVTRDDKSSAAQPTKRPRASQRDFSGRQMAARGAGIRFVEMAVNDPVERHRAGPGTNQGGEDQAEGSPARPAALVARGDHHGG